LRNGHRPFPTSIHNSYANVTELMYKGNCLLWPLKLTALAKRGEETYLKTIKMKKIITIGLTLVLPRIPILLSAYILSKESYSFFNKYYYTATMIILLSSFGFEFAISYSKTKYPFLISAILANVFITAIVMYFTVIEDLSLYKYTAIILYSFFITSANVITVRILYTGQTGIYLFANVINAFLLLFAIVLGRMFSGNGLIIGLTLGSALYFLSVMIIQMRNEKEQFYGDSLKDLYSIGFSSFVINSIVPLLLTADKFIVNHNFDNVTANSYTFAWLLASPLFYIGNVFEKMIYSSDKTEARKSLQSNFQLNILFISIYSVVIYGIINITDSFIPHSVSKELVRSISLLMLIGYSIFAMLHFPVNGYLFKYTGESVPKNIAVLYIIAATAFIVIYFTFKEELTAHYSGLLFFNFTALGVLLVIKIFIVFGPFAWKRIAYSEE
jgi:O-antigen/teichoic acid export membrane protein